MTALIAAAIAVPAVLLLVFTGGGILARRAERREVRRDAAYVAHLDTDRQRLRDAR